MFNGFCHLGNWGSIGTFGVLGGVGLVLYLVLWVGFLAGLALLVAWVLKRAKASTAEIPYATSPSTAKENLQAQYARGEITREQYELRERDIR